MVDAGKEKECDRCGPWGIVMLVGQCLGGLRKTAVDSLALAVSWGRVFIVFSPRCVGMTSLCVPASV